ncbi:pif6 [Cryptophlebia peltastica nucleopolyhedrovirus]|uniref:Pif6 n=1 Tax=Cryptophlebia peltastica nucleopolyhedrovirus TaxID=2304025 RepID=A0A346RNS4_9ABAC|nr:pif6 [Cryptophlebia peltastica nucleopolyhedrovirus]AXS67721.1 pif6 [Cryptophlebia peltastica nucleopolyhedrovirus]
MLDDVKWRVLNADRIEVSPEFRERAYKNLMIDLLLASPKYSAFRTGINKANFENFDYKRPLIYEIKNKQLLVTNEPLRRALDRPMFTAVPSGITLIQIVYAFICSIIIILLSINYIHYGIET